MDKKNIQVMKKQLKTARSFNRLGASKFLLAIKIIININKKLFIDFYNKGFVSRKETYVNWDPKEKDCTC